MTSENMRSTPTRESHRYGTNSWLLCITTFYYVLAIAAVHVPT